MQSLKTLVSEFEDFLATRRKPNVDIVTIRLDYLERFINQVKTATKCDMCDNQTEFCHCESCMIDSLNCSYRIKVK